MRSIPLALLLAVAVAVAALPSPLGAAVCTPAVQWIWDGPTRSPLFPDTCTTPVVVQINDDNGDGRIDPGDVPDVVFVHGLAGGGRVTALDGATGADHWTSTVNVLPGPLAAADLDGDGVVEIVAIERNQRNVVALGNDGTFKFLSDPGPVPLGRNDAIHVADLDQDGSPEIFVGAQVFSADGTLLWVGALGSGFNSRWASAVSHAVDLLPGTAGLEILAGNTCYDATGTPAWQNTALADGWSVFADLDRDGDPDIVLVGQDSAQVLDRLGNAVGAPYVVTGAEFRQPAIDDVDGNGRPEVVIAMANFIVAISWNGTGFSENWRTPVQDPSGATGPSTFDFDGDGAAEVVYHDEVNWYVIDGRNGAILSQIPLATATVMEAAIVADIDSDCAAEIVVGSCRGGVSPNSPQQLIAYECAGSAPARAIWNQRCYHGTNVNEDGTIPQLETPPWTQSNSFIGQVPYVSAVVADAGSDASYCDPPATLDGAGTTGCVPSQTEYRWSLGGVTVCDWSPSPTCVVTPATPPATYTLEVACRAHRDCPALDEVTIARALRPAAAAGADAIACTGATLTLDASGSADPGCPGGLFYEWREGAAVVRGWLADPLFTPSTGVAGTRTYTVAVACAAGGCESVDDVSVEVRSCPLSLRFTSVSASRVSGGGAVEVRWETRDESDTVAFRVERAAAADGPWTAIAGTVAASGSGSGSAYRLIDRGAAAAGPSWYRVVEYTSSGRGDVSGVVAVAALRDAGGSAGRARARTRR